MSERQTVEQRVRTLMSDLQKISGVTPDGAKTQTAIAREHAAHQLVEVHKFLLDLGMDASTIYPLWRVLEGLKDVASNKQSPIFQPDSQTSKPSEFELRLREVVSHLVNAHLDCGIKLDAACDRVSKDLATYGIRRAGRADESKRAYPAPTIGRWRQELLSNEAFKLRQVELRQQHPRWPKDEHTLGIFVKEWLGKFRAETLQRDRL